MKGNGLIFPDMLKHETLIINLKNNKIYQLDVESSNMS